MGFGHVALGLASLVLGFHHLNNATKRLGAGNGGEGLALARGGLLGRRGIDPNHPLVRASANTPIGRATLTTYEVRTLEDRIKRLRTLVQQGKRDPEIYVFARRAVSRKCGDKWCTPEKDNAAEIRDLFKAIRANVRYTSDIRGIDSYQRPTKTLGLRAGDCDDYSTISCASLESIGIPCMFKAIRTKGSSEFNHIYSLAGLPRARPTRWIPFDASVNMPVGWEAPPNMVAESKLFRLG